jgi:hypothetical protein
MNEHRNGIYLLTLSIWNDAQQSAEFHIDDLVENWRSLSDERFETALHGAWKEWAWEYIDGGATLIPPKTPEPPITMRPVE